MSRWLQFGLSSLMLIVLLCAAALGYWRKDLARWLEKPASQDDIAAPLLGFEGYCAVSMHQEMRWVRGDPRWAVAHEDRLYLFASENARATFLAAPNRFAPALRGDDIVELCKAGRQVLGDIRHGALYQDRMYLFSSESSLEAFERDPDRYVSGALTSTASVIPSKR